MEKIILSSDIEDPTEITEFTDKEKVRVRIVNGGLKQYDWLKGEGREFVIFNGRHCYQKVRSSNGVKKKFRANLKYLDPVPLVKSTVSYTHILLALFLMTISVVGLLVDVGAGYNVQLVVTYLSAGLLLFSVLLLFIGVNSSRQRIIFYSEFGEAPILELINNSPNKKKFSPFLRLLKDKIRDSKPNRPVINKQVLKDELKELQRLKNEGVLMTSAFNKAMKKIVRNRHYTFDKLP